MTVLPTNPGAVLLGAALRDPGPDIPRPVCALCHDSGWLNDAGFYGAVVGERCPACTAAVR